MCDIVCINDFKDLIQYNFSHINNVLAIAFAGPSMYVLKFTASTIIIVVFIPVYLFIYLAWPTWPSIVVVASNNNDLDKLLLQNNKCTFWSVEEAKEFLWK